MSGRRDRPPSGRHNQNSREKYESNHEINLSSRPQSARNRTSPRTEFQPNETSATTSAAANRRMNRPVSAHATSTNKGIGLSSSSPRIRSSPRDNDYNNFNTNNNSNTSNNHSSNNFTINTNYEKEEELKNSKTETDLLVQHFRDKAELEKRNAEAERTRMMGKFNAFSRPKSSLVQFPSPLLSYTSLSYLSHYCLNWQKYPLRSALLDSEINNYPPSKTRSELMKKIKISSIPHPSYDIVSHLPSLLLFCFSSSPLIHFSSDRMEMVGSVKKITN